MKSLILFFFLHLGLLSYSQQESNDTADKNMSEVTVLYLTTIEKKVNKYTHAVSKRTIRVLERLSRFEKRIKTGLEKVNPSAAKRLFGDERASFSYVLERIKSGEKISNTYKASFDWYSDKLIVTSRYLVSDTALGIAASVKKKSVETLDEYKEKLEEQASIGAFIEERKSQLLNEAASVLKKSKLFSKIGKESYYYDLWMESYKDEFSRQKTIEELALKMLSKIPGFNDFSQSNSSLSSVFIGGTTFSAPIGTMPVVNGLTPRSVVQQRIASALPQGTNPGSVDPVSIAASSSGLPGTTAARQPEFKVNSQKIKPFFKRLEKGFDLSFRKNSALLPSNASIAARLGYKLNDNSSIGIGFSYLLGIGKAQRKISFSNEGIGFRSYLNWFMKKGIGVQGGGEWNYNRSFKGIAELRQFNDWQMSALLGVVKKISINNRMSSDIQVLYDFLHQRNPASSPLIIRFGYSF